MATPLRRSARIAAKSAKAALPACDIQSICNNPSNLRFIDRQTYDICMMAVQRDPIALTWVKDKFKTPEMCNEVVNRNGYLIKYVPHHMQTYEMCIKAIKNNQWAIMGINPSLITQEMCNLLISFNGYFLRFIPEKFKTPDLCDLALKNTRPI